ncbi:MAG: hypothetical protein AAFO99_12635 [Bacteroidota bacterium]
MKKLFIPCLILSLSTACKTEKKSNPIHGKHRVLDTILAPEPAEKITDSTNFEEEYVEDEMKFMPPVENNSYFGIPVGALINDHQDVLKSGELKTGEGVFDVHYIIHKVDTLGYVFGNDIVESICIWDSRSSTNNGIGIGTTFAELKDILKQPNVHGSEVESRVYVFNENHRYRLNYYSMEYNLDYTKIPDTVVVEEIIIIK